MKISFFKNWLPKLSHVTNRLIKGLRLNQTSIKGENNQIIDNGLRSNVHIRIIGNNNYIEIGRQAKLSNLNIELMGDNHRLIIEDNCTYKHGGIAIHDSNGELFIGRDTSIEGATFSISEPSSKITLGTGCMLSDGIRIRNSDFHSIIDQNSNTRINYAKNISIEEHVWISQNATILKGVTIGKSSIVGAGAIVTKDVEANSIVAGNPARTIKKNITWTRELIYPDKIPAENYDTEK